MSEKQLPIVMACRLSIRYEVNQLRAVPDIPYHVDKRVMRMSWSMVSKAADFSSRVSAVTLQLSMLRLMSLCSFKEQFLLSEIVYTQTVTHWLNHLCRCEN